MKIIKSPKQEAAVIWLLSLSYLFSFAGHAFAEFYQNIKEIPDVHWFLDGKSHGCSNLWYFYLLALNLLFIILCALLSAYGRRIDVKLEILWVFWFCYHIIDLFGFLYNFSSSRELYLVLLAATVGSVMYYFFKPRAKVVRM